MRILLILVLLIASAFAYQPIVAFCRQRGNNICLKNIRYINGKNLIKYEPVSCLKKPCPREAYCDKSSGCVEEVERFG